jgi:hypothetical protein
MNISPTEVRLRQELLNAIQNPGPDVVKVKKTLKFPIESYATVIAAMLMSSRGVESYSDIYGMYVIDLDDGNRYIVYIQTSREWGESDYKMSITPYNF